MLLKQWMSKHYQGLQFAPSMWEKWSFFEQRELAKGQYQFLENGQYNEEMFGQAKKEISSLINHLFSKKEELTIVINTYPRKQVHRPFTQKIVKQKHLVSFSGQLIPPLNSEGVEQLILTTHFQNIRWETFIDCLLHQDFPDRMPRFSTFKGDSYPEVYFIEPNSATILHVYDDRGYELYFPSQLAKDDFKKSDK